MNTLWERVKGNEHLLSFAQSQDERQWALTEIQEFAFKYQENLSLRVVEHWNRLPRGGGVSVLGGSQNLIKCDPGQSAVADTLLSKGWTTQSPGVPSNLRFCEAQIFEVMFIFQVSLKHTVHLYLSL